MKKYTHTHYKAIIGVAIAVVLLCVWVWFAGGARQQTSFRQTDDRINQARRLTLSAFEGNQTKRLGAIKSLTGLKKDNTCTGDWWNVWQQSLVPNIKTGAQQCRAKEKKLAKISQAASGINAYLTDESKVTNQISLLKIDSSVKDWSVGAKKAAETALRGINGIRVIPSVKPVQVAAKTHTEAIITAWNSLNATSEKQDKTAYQAAEKQLEQAYVNLAAIADVSDTELQKLLGKLAGASKAL